MPPKPPASIARLAAQANAAREADRLEEALRLYRQALRLAPKWEEGWWHVGTIEYGLDHYPQCRDAFRRFTEINTRLSLGFAFLGLCEFQTKELGPSLAHLEKSVSLGMPNGEQITDVSNYHLAVLHTKRGDFERALRYCIVLAKRSEVNPNVVAIAGLAALRRPIFPQDLPEADRDLAFRLGNAILAAGVKSPAETNRLFEEVIRDYPRAPNVHYAFATAILLNESDRGIEELNKELEIDPDHLPSLVSLAFEYLKRGEPQTAKPFAERAAKAAPDNFAARNCLGRVLFAGDDAHLPAAIRELEAAVKLAPESPQVHFSLAAAYTKAGRTADAERERNEFARLRKLLDAENAP
jgi:tetratricopeptide (TPR) repeat protein